MTTTKKIILFIVITAIAFISIILFQDDDKETSSVDKLERKKQMQADRANAEFEMLKDPKTNQIPKNAAIEAYKLAKKERERALKYKSNTNIGVEVRGPSNYGGRARALAFDSRNPQIGISGGVSGGIFRTTNAAGSWTRVTPAGQIHNLTTVAQDRSSGNEDTWYAGTGEQIGNSATGGGSDDSNTTENEDATYHGNGVWKSTDNGATWAFITSTTSTLETFDSNWDFVHRIIVDPTNRNVYAGNAGGVYRSIDQGANWEQVLTVQNANSGTITEIIRTDGGIFYAAVSGDGVYRSPNGSLNSWTKIGGTSELGNSLGRIVLNFAPSDNNIIYALYNGEASSCNQTTSDIHLRRWDNSSGAWTGNYDGAISVCADTELQLDPQGGYNLCVAVRPNNADEIFIGGERLYRFTVTGTSTGNYVFAGGDQGNPTATNIHVDHHYLLFTDNNTLWSTNDGGMRSTDVSTTPDPSNGFSWDNKNQGLITYQFYRGDISPTNGSSLVGGGAQDNANNLIPTGTTAGTELGGGDGIQFALVSGTGLNDYNAITSIQNGFTFRNSPNSTEQITPAGSKQYFVTFFVLDGDNTDHLYYPSTYDNSGTNLAELYRTRTVSTVTTAVSGNSATGWEKMTLSGIGQFEDITSMGLSRNRTYNNAAYSSSDTDRKLYIGTDGGQVYRLSDPAYASSYNLTNITPNGATGYLSDIAVNPDNDKEILVTFSNYNVTSIYHTLDATAGTVSWTAVEGAANSAVEKASIRSAMITTSGASTIYMVGTSTGLYCTSTLNGINTIWEQVSPIEIAFALCVDMRLRTSDNKISLATHGNGMYILSPGGNTSNCAISAIEAGNTSNCDPATNSYSQTLTITYNDPPAGGNLIVNGQTFPIGTSPQEVMLTGLIADGQSVDVTASFFAEPTCTFSQSATFVAPTSCTNCISINNTASVDIPDESFVTSTITVPSSGIISDVNIFNLRGTHEFMQDLTFELTSPLGTKITLFAQLCLDDNNGFIISLDDAATSAIMCPLNDNQTEMPSGDLSDFNGQEAMGTWILTITDDGVGDVGTLESWTLEICGSFGGGNDCDNPPPASGAIAAATYQNNGAITTTGSIASPNVVLFKAKDCIGLDDDFSVADGATLDCIIEDCVTSVKEDDPTKSER